MAAALSTTLRAALPGPSRRAQRALGLHRGEALVRRLDADAERLEQLAQRRRLVERGAGGRADVAREAQREPDHDRRRLDLADGLDHGRRSRAGSPLRSIVPHGLARLRPLSL